MIAAKNLHVAILTGGATHERDVSLRSAHHCANALQNQGFSVSTIEFGPQTLDVLRDGGFDVILPLVHGGPGEDGTLQTLLELLGIPFVGTNSKYAALATFKPAAKTLVSALGVSTPDFVTLPRSLFTQLGSAELLSLVTKKLEYPLVVKPACGGSSLGVSVALDFDSLRAGLVDAFAYADTALVEKYVHGREISVSLVEQDGRMLALPLVEVETESGVYDYSARYESGRTIFFAPAELNSSQRDSVLHAGLAAAEALHLRHFARIDVILDEHDRAWFIDANVAPGMTEMSLFPQAAEVHSGFGSVLAGVIAGCAKAQ